MREKLREKVRTNTTGSPTVELYTYWGIIQATSTRVLGKSHERHFVRYIIQLY
jgi:hypothetical protein